MRTKTVSSRPLLFAARKINADADRGSSGLQISFPPVPRMQMKRRNLFLLVFTAQEREQERFRNRAFRDDGDGVHADQSTSTPRACISATTCERA